ncbi:hypothetical protein SAMN05443270_1070 [Lacrimispora sphenoides]|uniref:hypothetical protein n=1 Tax=Lacrimispora sphenoides TaxID=29370 RepID=UPI0008C7A7AD|nr:hypothetical protein [Lacrimispora sphenoides]SET71122.1 hypothetical protein SAMN05443270_1070 [Lacrimispora sphenoides]
MYTDTVTIFNKLQTGQVITWYPTVLHNVDLNVDKGANVTKTGLESADTAKLHIRYTLVDGAITIAGKPYKRPKEWATQIEAEIAASLTFTGGTDFFIRGEYPGTVINDAEYKKDFKDYITKTRDDVYLITTVGGPYKLIPHFEIGGK